MPKNIFEDIKPISREPHAEIHKVSVPKRKMSSLPHEVPFTPSTPRRASRHGLWYIAVICIIGAMFSLSFLFEKANVTVVPKKVSVAFDASDTFTAYKDTGADDKIIYTVMTLSGDESMKLPSTESKDVSEYAKGVVVLYNEYSTTTSYLAKNTLLKTADGRSYKLDNAVTIPGYTKSGADIIPGSIEASVTAVEAGEAGNMALSDFKGDFSVASLAGTTKGKKIYGRIKSDITGGLKGLMYSISQDDAQTAQTALVDKLKSSLLSKAKVQVPDGYLLYEGATKFTPNNDAQSIYSKESDVPIALSGSLTAYLIKEDTLVKAIAQKYVSQYNGENIKFPDISKLTLTSQADFSPDTDTEFNFNLEGSGNLVWQVDTDKIADSLVGHKKSELEQILNSNVSVDNAEVVIKPFWKRSFPSEKKNIFISVEK